MNPPEMPRFGKYQLVEQLETAGTATLYRATVVDSDRPVLLRVLSRSASENPSLARFYETLQHSRERVIDHPHVLQLLDAGRVDDRYYMAFEYVDAVSLARMVEQKRLSHEEIIAIIKQAAEGLRAIHHRHIVHGDVKPANIMVGRDASNHFRVKLAPVDLASSAAEAMISVYGELLGSPRYMAPEQIEGRPVGPRTDIYALGIVAYELFAHRAAFEVENALGYLRAHCERDPVPLAQLDTSIPTEVSLVVQKMLMRDPRLRYRNSQNLIEDLERLETRMAGDFAEVVPAGVDSAFAGRAAIPPPLPRAASSWRFLAVVSVVATGVLLALVVWLFIEVRRLKVQPPINPPAPAVVPAPAVNTNTTTSTAAAAAASVNPDELDFRALERSIESFSLRRRYDDALRTIDAFVEKHKGTSWENNALALKADILRERGRVEEGDGNFTAALDTYGRIVAEYPGADAARQAAGAIPYVILKQARAAQTDNKPRIAADFLAKVIKDFPDTDPARDARRDLPAVLLAWADDSLKDRNPGEAVGQLRRLATEFADVPQGKQAVARLPEVELSWGQQLLGAGNYTKAVDVLGSLRKAHPDTYAAARAGEAQAQALAAWAQKDMASGDVEEAFGLYERLQKEFPESPALKALGGDLAAIHALSQKLQLKAEAEGREATLPEVLYAWAEKLRAEKKPDAAREWLQRLAKKHPDSPEGKRAAEALAAEVLAQARQQIESGTRQQGLTQLRLVVRDYPNTGGAADARAELARWERVPKGMVYVPAGSFVMGADLQDLLTLGQTCEPKITFPSLVETLFGNEAPRHKVAVAAFYIDSTEVTNVEFKKFVDAAGGDPPPSSAWDGKTVRPGFEDHPVVGVSFADAEAYAKWAGKRLPTEEEWEKAARGADGRWYPWGSEFEPKFANLKSSGGKEIVAVGRYPQGASPYGALDMVGNVWEWTSSDNRPYPGNEKPAKEPTYKITRGASFQESSGYDATVTIRIPQPLAARLPILGFRCALSVAAAGVATAAGDEKPAPQGRTQP